MERMDLWTGACVHFCSKAIRQRLRDGSICRNVCVRLCSRLSVRASQLKMLVCASVCLRVPHGICEFFTPCERIKALSFPFPPVCLHVCDGVKGRFQAQAAHSETSCQAYCLLDYGRVSGMEGAWMGAISPLLPKVPYLSHCDTALLFTLRIEIDCHDSSEAPTAHLIGFVLILYTSRLLS